jgi:translation initiation factor IF-3
MNRRKETEDKWSRIIGNLQTTTSTSSSFPNMLPVAKTIGLDLVSVQPMSAPLNILPYIDYQYGDIKHTTRKRKINNIFKVNE